MSGRKLTIPASVLIAGVVVMIFGAIFLPGSLKTIKNAGPTSYGQGYVHFFSAMALCICGLAIVGGGLLLKEPSDPIQWRGVCRGLGITVVSLIAYIAVIKVLGFGVATFLLLAVLFRILKAYSWRATLIIAVVMAIVFHSVFRSLLDLPLPSGLLF